VRYHCCNNEFSGEASACFDTQAESPQHAATLAARETGRIGTWHVVQGHSTDVEIVGHEAYLPGPGRQVGLRLR
jgi:hypothetical protein